MLSGHSYMWRLVDLCLIVVCIATAGLWLHRAVRTNPPATQKHVSTAEHVVASAAHARPRAIVSAVRYSPRIVGPIVRLPSVQRVMAIERLPQAEETPVQLIAAAVNEPPPAQEPQPTQTTTESPATGR